MLLAEMIQRADNKDPKAMFELAEVYYYGKNGVKEDDEKAYRLYKELETLTPDDGMVLYRLGKCYELGLSVEKNIDLALEYFQKAVEKGAGIACWRLGDLYKAGEVVPKDMTKCLEYMLKGVELGSQEAAVTLGNMYHFADGVEKDDAKSFEYYKIAAELGNINAYHRLGLHTYNGWGVDADIAQGMEYWKKGAELNQLDCMNIIGLAYLEEGTDLPQNTELGLYWLERCADRGLPEARYTLGETYLKGLHGVPKSEKKGVQHLRAAAEAGHAGAMAELGSYLMDLETVEGYSEAYKWLSKAAEQDEPAAYAHLGLFYLYGQVVEKDTAKGLAYWVKGAESGDQVCMNLLGQHSLLGKIIPYDVDRGVFWLEKATDLGLPDARNFLGKTYLNGLYGVPQNESKGVQYLTISSESNWPEIAIPAMIELGDYYWNQKTSKGIDEAAKWYEKCADKGVPYAARMAVKTNMICALSGAVPSVRQADPLSYEFNVEEWAKVAALAQKEIDLLQRGTFEGRDEQLELARGDLCRAKYEQAICCYEMKNYSEAMSLVEEVKFRDSDLLYALAHFMSVSGESNEAFLNTFREVVSAFLKLKKGEQLTTEEEQFRASAASVVAEGYWTGVSGVLPQNLKLAEETLKNTIAGLTDSDYIHLLNKQLEKYGFSAAAPIVTTPPKPVVDPPSPTPTEDPPKPVPVDNPPKSNPGKDSPKPIPSTDPPEPKSDDGGDGPGIKPLLYALIGLAGLAVILLLILVLGKKDNGQTDMPVAVDPTIQVAESLEDTETPKQNNENEVASVAAAAYQMPTSIQISHPWEFYGARQNYEYTADGMPLSCEVEVEGSVYSTWFEYMESNSIQTSSLFIDDEQVCLGEYLYDENGNVEKIIYSFYGLFSDLSGDVSFSYGKEGNTYFVDIHPNITGDYPYYQLPESFFEIPGIGTISFEHDEKRLEFQLNDDGMVQQIHVRNPEDYVIRGEVIQFYSNGIPSMIAYENEDPSENYQMKYSQNGVPTAYNEEPVETISSLHIGEIDFEESAFDKLIRIPGPESTRYWYEYEEYKTDEQHSVSTRIRYNITGDLMEQEDYQWVPFTYKKVVTPFPFFYHQW